MAHVKMEGVGRQEDAAGGLIIMVTIRLDGDSALCLSVNQMTLH